MNTILETLYATLPRDSRRIVTERFQALERQLDYLVEKKHKRVQLALKMGWSVKKLKTILALNSFYQTILSPLASSARECNRPGPFANIDIVYGTSFKCDNEWRTSISSADADFHDILNQMEINRFLMIQQKTEDILYQITQFNKDE